MLAVVSGFFLQRESSIRRGIFLSVWTRKPENKTSTLHIIIYSIKRRRHQVISGVNKNTPGECEVLLKLNWQTWIKRKHTRFLQAHSLSAKGIVKKPFFKK